MQKTVWRVLAIALWKLAPHGVNTINKWESNLKCSDKKIFYPMQDQWIISDILINIVLNFYFFVVIKEGYIERYLKNCVSKSNAPVIKHANCQVYKSAPWWSYLKNLEIDDKLVNKRVQLLCINRCVSLKCVEKKKIGRHNKAISLKIAFAR